MNAFSFTILYATYVFYLFLISKKYLHIFQLYAYSNKRYLNWFLKNVLQEVGVLNLLPIIVVALFIFVDINVFIVVWFFLYVLLFLSRKYPKEKKRFVITSRVKRLYLALFIQWLCLFYLGMHIVTNSLTSLLIVYLTLLAILGEIKIFYVIMANIINYPIEKIVCFYYYNDAKKIINKQENLKVIGVTGSYGKTSSKFILNDILSLKYNVLMTPESYNTLMGVVKIIRGKLKATHEIFIVEMGAERRGEILELCQLVEPKYGLLTAIGYQHLETQKTIENIIESKYELVNSVKDGITFLNFDNDFIRGKKSEGIHISYSIINRDTNYWAENISYDIDGSVFTLCSYKSERIDLRTRLLGKNNISNIVAASAIAMELGVSIEDIKYAVNNLPYVPHRLEIKQEVSGVTIVDNTFSSNPEGANESLNILSIIDSPKKILVTPGLVELGDQEYEFNKALGIKAANIFDCIILIGLKRSKPIKDGILSSDYPTSNLFIVKNLEEAMIKLQELVSDGSIILFENDLPDNYDE